MESKTHKGEKIIQKNRKKNNQHIIEDVGRKINLCEKSITKLINSQIRTDAQCES
jgi:hypothetical protein